MVYIVFCNCSPGESPYLAKTLVEQRLAACVNVIRGVTSYYVWEGEFTEDEEHTLIIKTSAPRLDELQALITEIHSYDTPEIVAVAADKVNGDYEAWVEEQTI